MKLTPTERRQILNQLDALLAKTTGVNDLAYTSSNALKAVDDQRLDLDDAAVIICWLTERAMARKGELS
jgi:hypothetical protein